MSEKDKSKRDLEQVIKQEGRRGRRPIDLEARRKRTERLADMRKLLLIATREEFLEAMRAAGLNDDSPGFLEALRIWSESDLRHHSTKRLFPFLALGGGKTREVRFEKVGQLMRSLIEALPSIHT